MTRRSVVPFVSYAHADTQSADLLDRLWREAGPSRRYEYRPWQDTAILVGEDWAAAIATALAACDLGLLLVSPAFLASKYIYPFEVSALKGHPLIPVLLARVDPERHDLRGLEKLQLFGLPDPDATSLRLRSYAECSGKQRDRFVSELFAQIERRLDKTFGTKP